MLENEQEASRTNIREEGGKIWTGYAVYPYTIKICTTKMYTGGYSRDKRKKNIKGKSH